MKPEEVTIELGATSVEAVAIYKLPSGTLSHDPVATTHFGARGPKGARILSRAEYLVLRAAGARDETPWA